MSIKLHNTLTGTIDELKPHSDGTVKLYTCGLTVYSQPHVGNWLGYIYWDVLVRLLESYEYSVERTQNITDVGHLTDDADAGGFVEGEAQRQRHQEAQRIGRQMVEAGGEVGGDLVEHAGCSSARRGAFQGVPA